MSGKAGGGTVLIGGDWSGGNPDQSLVNNVREAADTRRMSTPPALDCPLARVAAASIAVAERRTCN